MTVTFIRHSITLVTAKRIAEAAEAMAVEMGLMMAIAIVDDSGALKTFSRMDGAPLLAVDLAIDKAYTSAAYGIATHAWHDFIKNDPPLLHGITKVPRLITFGGGYPIEIDGEVVGAIGVSGGHYKQDMEVAQAGLALIEAGGYASVDS